MYGLIAAVVMAAAPPAASAPPAGLKLWMMNSLTSDKKVRCRPTTLARAIDGLKKQAKEHPNSFQSYQFLNDGGKFVLRVLMKPGKEPPSVFFFVETEALCQENWRSYLIDPFWGYDEKRVFFVTSKGVTTYP